MFGLILLTLVFGAILFVQIAAEIAFPACLAEQTGTSGQQAAQRKEEINNG